MSYPNLLPHIGLSDIKKVKLGIKWRPYVPSQYQDIICPIPDKEVINRNNEARKNRKKAKENANEIEELATGLVGPAPADNSTIPVAFNTEKNENAVPVTTTRTETEARLEPPAVPIQPPPHGMILENPWTWYHG
mmetsp:Transcript_27361/g.41404  ORF Transcript_27361/g.41404 Transcript_27361/m.41404 type:complete len:135 (+) Transcript_27361:308-712(+)|eukprot:CAMPEP_0178919496 /NCGR_PEP_ID=MMETSP0786-20121207/14468_1 /TAXON_ID=186022 /ORGANISM="Thalassionema frauenfeldii, Strain CCMP 1798" /LENGTH=134 /DNA_ID=CAMNT_0020593431 /DNA_START=275 /DNA_END=679 /DNA_ORIENTATION=-